MTTQDFKNIDKIIAWFQSLPVGHDQLERLMAYRRELSAINVRLARYVGDLSREFNNAYGLRKASFYKEKQRYIEEGMSATAAETKAESEIDELRLSERDCQGRFDSGRFLAKSVDQVLNAMAGEINFLREEKVTVGHRQN